jgi:hypothetical protein
LDQISDVIIFHLKDPKDRSIFYHSLENPRDLTLLGSKTSIRGFYGTEPDFEAFRLFKQSIHQNLREEIRQQSLSRTFIPRFLLSSLVFLIIFLFLSLAVRDPIPLIDEILIALAGASVVWVLKSRKIKRNNQEAEQELLIRDIIEKGFFTPREQLLELEKLWQEVYLDFQNRQLEDIESYIVSLSAPAQGDTNTSLEIFQSLESTVKAKISKGSQKHILAAIARIAKGKLLGHYKQKALIDLMKKDLDSTNGQEKVLYLVLVVLRVFQGNGQLL